jgi:hypothetical protein
VGQGKLVSVHLEIVLILMQDRCTVCIECTIGSKIILDTPKLLRDMDQVKAHFSPFGDFVNVDASRCIVCAERPIGSKTILDAPDGTPR